MKVESTVRVKKTCPDCGKQFYIHVDEEGYEKWKGGMLIQNALPHLSAEIRECLISGMCLSCQEKFFGSEDED